MKKILFLLILPILITILDFSCRKPSTIQLTVEDILISNFSLTQKKSISINDSINFNDYAIQLDCRLLSEVIACRLNSSKLLYATSLAEDEIILKSKVSNISIFSNADLNEYYQAGTELKTIFIPHGIFNGCLNTDNLEYPCLRDYSGFEYVSSIEDAFNEIFIYNSYFSKIELRETFELNVLKLTIGNVEPNIHTFTIIFEFDDGNKIEIETDEIKII